MSEDDLRRIEDLVLSVLRAADRPLSVQDISGLTLVPVDRVNRAVGILLQRQEVQVYEQERNELELELAHSA